MDATTREEPDFTAEEAMLSKADASGVAEAEQQRPAKRAKRDKERKPQPPRPNHFLALQAGCTLLPFAVLEIRLLHEAADSHHADHMNLLHPVHNPSDLHSVSCSLASRPQQVSQHPETCAAIAQVTGKPLVFPLAFGRRTLLAVYSQVSAGGRTNHGC